MFDPVARRRDVALGRPTLVVETQVERLGLAVQRHALQPRVEQVEGEQAAGREVRAHAGQAGELLLHRVEVLKRAEGGENQPESLGAEIEGLHAGAGQLHCRRPRLAVKLLQHRGRQVQTRAVHAALCNRE